LRRVQGTGSGRSALQIQSRRKADDCRRALITRAYINLIDINWADIRWTKGARPAGHRAIVAAIGIGAAVHVQRKIGIGGADNA
jgi:hypothetical protein